MTNQFRMNFKELLV